MSMRGFPRWLVTATAWFALPVALLLAPGCSQDENPVVEPSDTTPPASSSLRIVTVTSTSVTLAWQAPGDDGMLFDASRYELRYANFELTDENFEQGALAPDLFPPDPPRSPQQLTIAGLTAGVTYYFAMRTADEVPNWSRLSVVLDLTIPENDTDPMLWGGSRLPASGTTLTAFVYETRLRVPTGQPNGGLMEVMVADTTYAMQLVRVDGVNRYYEYSLCLPAGSYDYRFRYTRPTGEASFLPDPGVWGGPLVEDVQVTAPAFVEVPVDTFRMGNPLEDSPREERPAHLVVLTRPLVMDRYEITNAQVCGAFNRALAHGAVAVLGDTMVISTTSGARLLITAPQLEQTEFSIRYTPETGFTPLPHREDWPVGDITWFGAAFFCNLRSEQDGLTPAYDEERGWACGPDDEPYQATGWRLPTEAEWEHVARNGDGRLYPTGNEPPVAGVQGNFDGAAATPAPVGSYPSGANPLGILDLSGNVWEWCNDWLDFYELTVDQEGNEVPQADPRGPHAATTYRVSRGGSYGTKVEDLRCSRRMGFRPEMGLHGVGFRCVKALID